MFFKNPYIKARNALVRVWMVVIGSLIMGLAAPTAATILIAYAKPESVNLHFEIWLLIAFSIAVANRIAILFFTTRGRIGIIGCIIRWILSVLLCAILAIILLSNVQKYHCLEMTYSVILLLVVWLAITIVEPIISIAYMRKLTEQYRTNRPHKAEIKEILVQRRQAQQRKIKAYARSRTSRKYESSFSWDYNDAIEIADYEAEQRRKEALRYEEYLDELEREEIERNESDAASYSSYDDYDDYTL